MAIALVTVSVLVTSSDPCARGRGTSTSIRTSSTVVAVASAAAVVVRRSGRNGSSSSTVSRSSRSSSGSIRNSSRSDGIGTINVVVVLRPQGVQACSSSPAPPVCPRWFLAAFSMEITG